MSSLQYTIRNVPADLDKRLRQRAKKSGQSFNATLLLALETAIGKEHKAKNSDLDWFYGSGGIGEEELAAFAAQDVIDEEAWNR